MKKSYKFLFIALILSMVAVVLFFVSCKKSSTDSPSGPATWTVIVYGDGNNNLDTLNNNTSFIIDDIHDMQQVGSQPGLNIIAMVSSIHSSGNAKYYKIEYKPNDNEGQLTSQILRDDLGTQNMASYATLKTFINYCKANFPADHYLLVIDDHGAGWRGSCEDNLNGGGALMSMPDMKRAISESDLHHVDIVTFHACLMAMVEVGYELRNVATYMTASQFKMPMKNVLGANLWLDWMKNNPGAAPADVGRKIVADVIAAAEHKGLTAHYSMIDLSQMELLGSKVGHMGTTLIGYVGNHWDEVADAWNHTHTSDSYDDPANVDLLHLTNLMKNETNLSANTMIRNSLDDVVSAMSNAIVVTNMRYEAPDQPIARGGLCIYLPLRTQDYSDSLLYKQLEFGNPSTGTNWNNFISALLPNGGGGQDPVGRCCYNNNTQCGDGTQAACANLQGTWTEGVSCADAPCQQAANCPVTCPTAVAIAVGQTIQCSFTAADTANWLYVPITAGTYRFVLCGFTGQTDYDLYLYSTCTQIINECAGVVVGCEDFNCQFTGQGNLGLRVHRYQGTGSYNLTVTQVAGKTDSVVPTGHVGLVNSNR